MIASPKQKLPHKIRESRQLIIHNIQKSIKSEMLWKYLEQNHVQIKNFHMKKSGLIQIDFTDHEKALNYYRKANFKDKILFRPLNIYFKLKLEEDQVKKYQFEGLQQNNMRKFFEIVQELGISKIYTNYGDGCKGKLETKGSVQFIRIAEITEDQLSKVNKKLDNIGMKLYKQGQDCQKLKCSIFLCDFYETNLKNQQEQISQSVIAQVNAKMEKILGKQKIQNMRVSPQIHKKQVSDTNSQTGNKFQTEIKACIDFEDYEQNIAHFQFIRLAFLKEPKARAKLNFYNLENNSYLSLFTMGLIKKQKFQELTDKQFENQVVEIFRKINQNVVQVNLFPISFSNIYVGRVYLKDQISGKHFLVNYPQKREFLVDLYKTQKISFDINIDNKTQKGIKKMQENVHMIQNAIKNTKDRQKRWEMCNNQNYHIPLYIPRGSQGGEIPMGFPHFGINLQLLVPHPIDIKMKIKRLIQDKEKYINDAKKDERVVKKILVEAFKYTIENNSNVHSQQIGSLINKLMTQASVKDIIQFMEDPKSKPQFLKMIQNFGI